MIKKTASELLKEKLYPLNISSDISKRKKLNTKKLKELAKELRRFIKDENSLSSGSVI